MILTREQKDAVEHDSHVFLNACPGSGKTRAIVAKLLRCIGEVRGTTRRVACITYTNAAVHEIEHRLRQYCQNGDEDLCEVSTIHTFCLNCVLRSFFWRLPSPILCEGFQIASPDSESFTQCALDVIESHGLEKKASEAFESLNRNLDGSPACPETEVITPAAAIDFWQRLESKGQMDFCSIVYWTHFLLCRHESIAAGVASRFAWILVDEFQDTSELQVEILTTIGKMGRTHFFAVGDPFQSIYSFSGARPELMEEFCRRFGAKTDFRLLANFRSSSRVIMHAERLLARVPSMKAHGPSADHPFDPVHVDVETRFLGIIEQFLPAIEEFGIAHGQAAILAPTWYTLVPLARQLRDYGVPVVGPGARPYKSTRVFARFAEQICAYIERPRPERVQEIEKELFILIANLNGKAEYSVFSYEGRRVVFELIRIGRELREESESAVRWLEHAADGFCNTLCQFGLTNESQASVLQESASLMVGDMENRDIDIENLVLNDLGMFACPDANLKLLTFHGAKGREFDAVALVDLHEGKIPNWHVGTDQKRLEESKRLFYVGMTRARKVLFYFTDRADSRNRPTRFLQAVQAKRIVTDVNA